MSHAVEAEGTARSCNVVELRHSTTKDAVEAGRWVRFFTKEGVHPFDEIKWKTVDARITNPKGEVVSEQIGVEVPSWWNQTTVNIVSDKYFRVIDGVKEKSVKQMIRRVAKALRAWAQQQNYFNGEEDGNVYEDELCHVLLHQYGAFNSPVWFNIGVPGRKQVASACFISGVEDTLDSIMDFQKSEVKIFAGGSGSGVNISSLRSSWEKLSSGSFTSGPLAWMKGLDKYAEAMKSGGSTRNAAKMIVMDMDHPDILETRDGRPGFIRCKSVSEQIVHDLFKIGHSVQYDDPNSAYRLVPYQNANHSVSIPDKFMRAVENGEDWVTTERTTGKQVHKYSARDLWKEIAEAAWACGDPGVQFTDTINRWHTTPKAGKIRSTNPCFQADTRVATESGLVRIEDLYAQVMDGEVRVAVHMGDRMELKSAIVFPTGMNPIFQVKFRNGRVLEVTPDHTFLLRDGTKKQARELTVRKVSSGEMDGPDRSGDVVDIQCSEGWFGDFDCGLSSPTEWYRIAGFVVGDGWITKTRTNLDGGVSGEVGICFGKDDKDCLERVKSFLDKEGVAYNIRRQSGSVGESPDYLRIRRKCIFEAMEKIASPAGSRSFAKRIQPGVFTASKINQLAFLDGLFSADGTFRMSAKGHGGKIPTREMRLSSTSLGLLRDVQALLLNLGIKSNIIENRQSKKSRKATFKYVSVDGSTREYGSQKALHELFVYGHSLRRLRDGMKSAGGMLSSRKQSRLDDLLPEGFTDPIHDIWWDEVVEVVDTGRVELTYNMTEPETHTIIAEGVRIPQCSEFSHVDNTACNLAALNLLKFFDDGEFDFEKFEFVVRVLVTAQNAIIAKAEYPTPAITENSKKLRPIGLNYGNLGALIMKLGYGYDSNEGRGVAARMASFMTGCAYKASAKLAARIGAFPAWEENSDDMMLVMARHADAYEQICTRWSLNVDPIGAENRSALLWKDTIELGRKYGYSVSQATVQAPLGTLSFLMEMDTTGIEPAFSLVSYKSLVGGGVIKMVCDSVKDALKNLGYSELETTLILEHIEKNDCIEGAESLKPEHLPIFDGSLPSGTSSRCLTPMAHVKMLAAIQPLITCSMSKTVNMPNASTVDDIADVYMKAWKLGIKCIALYRDMCKLSQPLVTKKSEQPKDDAKSPEVQVIKRRRLPADIEGKRHRFTVGGFKGYISTGEYPDGSLGEVFLRVGKTGSTISGLIDGFTKLLSISLQYGVPLDKIIRSLAHTKFEPAGFTDNPMIRFADSPYDYLFKYLDFKYFGGKNSGMESKVISTMAPPEGEEEETMHLPPDMSHSQVSSPMCSNCGSITRRVGTCFFCSTCGTSTGCS